MESAELICPRCENPIQLETLLYCRNCGNPVCDTCERVYEGCALAKRVACFTCSHQSDYVRLYCPGLNCVCKNLSPESIELIETEEKEKLSRFRASINKKAWRNSHQRIAFPSHHSGKYLIDVYFENSKYVLKMLKYRNDCHLAQIEHVNYKAIIKEADEILKARRRFEAGKLAPTHRYSLRSPSPKRARK